MPPITWQNVEAPNLHFIAQGFNSAQAGISEGFKNLADTLKQETNTNVANWDNQAKNNTEKFYSDVASQFKTPEEYQAALKSGLVDQLRQQYGAQIDQAGARKYADERLGTLQQRALTGIDYTNKSTEAELRPQIQQALALAASDKKGFDTFMANNPRLAEFMGGDLTAKAIAGDRATETFKRDGLRLENDLQNGETNRKVAVGTLNVARQNANTSAEQARNTGLHYAAQLTQDVANRQGNILKDVTTQLSDLDEKRAKLDKDSVFKGGEYKDEHAPDLVKVAKDAGLSPGAVGDFLTQVKDAYPKGYIESPDGKGKIPITKGLLETAIVQGAGKFGWGFGGVDIVKGNQIFNSFQGIVNKPGLADSYGAYINAKSLLDAQQAAIKEQGQQRIQKLDGAAQPYVEAFTSKLASKVNKPTSNNPFQ